MFQFENVAYKDIIEIPNLVIDKDFTVITGSSGGGKTTLLRLLNKLISPTKGTIYYKGKNMEELPSVKLRQEVMMLSQNAILFKKNIRDNLNMIQEYRGLKAIEDKRLEAVLKKLDLDLSLEGSVDNLSGGEKQRISLARLLLSEAKVLLLDEPTASLDDVTEMKVMKILKREVEEKKRKIIMITHTQEIADQYGEMFIEIKNHKAIIRKEHS